MSESMNLSNNLESTHGAATFGSRGHFAGGTLSYPRSSPTRYQELMSNTTRDAVAANPGVHLAGYHFVDHTAGGVILPGPCNSLRSDHHNTVLWQHGSWHCHECSACCPCHQKRASRAHQKWQRGLKPENSKRCVQVEDVVAPVKAHTATNVNTKQFCNRSLQRCAPL